MATGIGATLTASATYSTGGAAGAVSASFTASQAALPLAPSGVNGFIVTVPTSGNAPTGAFTAITTAQAVNSAVPANSSGHVYAMVVHSLIA